MNPTTASRSIRDSYVSYLTTAFPIRDAQLAKQFRDALCRPDRFVKGPILESTPPFKQGSSIDDLIHDGVLSEEFRRIPSSELPSERLLYSHQEQAIRKAVRWRRNLVVASGTGSGKTEAFLIPILQHLFREKGAGTLTPGVRALLLYPMNALANDQMNRLRKLLRNHPWLTFGRYTGETVEGEREARDVYQKIIGGDPLPNERLSRVAMRDAPPHILLTNYAMLEYLLLRPKDTPFFDGAHADSWRFVVLDEAHTYAGAKGIEIGMLVRRVKDRVVRGNPGALQCFATSATLGRGIEDAPGIVAFARELFGEAFEWEPHDLRRQDVVVAERLEWQDPDPAVARFATDPGLSADWSAALADGDQSIQRLVDCGVKGGIPRDLLQGSAAASGGSVNAFLFNVLRNDARVGELRVRLEQGPMMMTDMAKAVFHDCADPVAALVHLVDLAARARRDQESLALLPARYHLFVRAIEGAYIQFTPETRVLLDRTSHVEDDAGKRWPVFEMSTCRNCGALYLAGREAPDPSESGVLLEQVPAVAEDGAAHFLVQDRTVRDDEDDEDEEILFGDKPPSGWVPYVLCTSCGRLWQENQIGGPCDCGADRMLSLLRAPSSEVHYCPACGRRNPGGQVVRFLAGTDASAAVIATSVYQAGVSRRPRSAHVVIEDEPEPDDEWAPQRQEENVGAGATGMAIQDSGDDVLPARLLVFSDGRQDAAYFAPYLNRTYSRILSRRLICAVLEENRKSIAAHRWRMEDLVEPLVTKAGVSSLFPSDQGLQARRAEARKWIMAEFLSIDRHNSLESQGFLSFSPARPDGWVAPVPLTKSPWALSSEEIWSLIRTLLDTLRITGVVTYPQGVRPDDEEFEPRNREAYIREQGSRSGQRILSWCPNVGRSNSRLDYLARLAAKLGMRDSKEQVAQLLRDIWRRHLVPGISRGVWDDHFAAIDVKGEGVVYQLRHGMWELAVPEDPERTWYKCDTCGQMTRVSVKGICPAFRCNGTLQSYDSPGEATNHYARLYRTLLPVRLRAEEHTAQLNSAAAAELQVRFTKGDVDVLSCSTTFELGVDLGSLETVFLRNMPPTPANYVQRAGRAGRRTESAAFVTTFARRLPHDREFYREPHRMVAGRIRPPHFRLENEKIVRRHMAAMAIAYLWRVDRESHGDKGYVQAFFDNDTGPGQLMSLLGSRPIVLQESLRRVVPESLHQVVGIEDWSWVDALFDENTGPLPRAAQEYYRDRDDLERVYTELVSARKASDHILRLLHTIKERDIVGYLASRSVLPKYGFPVDSVELKISWSSGEARRLELDRDLRIALSEYAPGSKVIAGGWMWTSRYLRRPPRRDWPRFRFVLCPSCGSYHRVQADSPLGIDRCEACGGQLDSATKKGVFVIPEFGFATEPLAPQNPPSIAPRRSYSTRVFLWGSSVSTKEAVEVSLPGGSVTTYPGGKGRLAVLNTGRNEGFRVCHQCGYGLGPGEKSPKVHNDPRGRPCGGTLKRVFLGHEFDTDILLVSFPSHHDSRQEFWLSLLYGLLEGASMALDIERRDLDGCLHPLRGDPRSPALVLFDDVPGGAGQVRRLNDAATLREVLEVTLRLLSSCECGTSCSGCLRNYNNQFCHDVLDRRMIVEFLEQVLGTG